MYMSLRGAYAEARLGPPAAEDVTLARKIDSICRLPKLVLIKCEPRCLVKPHSEFSYPLKIADISVSNCVTWPKPSRTCQQLLLNSMFKANDPGLGAFAWMPSRST